MIKTPNHKTKFINDHTRETNDSHENYDNRDESENLVRTHIVKSMFKDLLGPKLGYNETIENPYDKYIVGILKPHPPKTESTDSTVIDDEHAPRSDAYQKQHSELEAVTDPYEKASFEELTGSQDFDFEPFDEDFTIPVDADLNLMRGAYSLGLSFVVSGANPVIHICCTWGKYKLTQSNTYKRYTNVIVTNPINVSTHGASLLKSKSYKINTALEHGAEIYVNRRPIPNKQRWNVSVFLLNSTAQLKSQNKKSQWNVQSFFQPQIRITCEDSKLEDLGTGNSDVHAEDYLYHNKPTKGRGHLCGVVWRDVDPGCLDNNDLQDVLWPDSQSLKNYPEIKKQFSCPDIRTEYFPMYVILQPDMHVSADSNYSAQHLSKLWDPNTLKNKLAHIVRDYEKWITEYSTKLEQEHALHSTQHAFEKFKLYADKRLKECRNCAIRIHNGIQLLLDDEKARLAFCFMNKVIALKSQWGSTPNIEFSWRPFQIAFILQTLPGLTIPGDEKEKDVCDVLWFPTGGGKTEAYMGLMLFSFAYRRLCTDKEFDMDGGVTVISRYTLRLLSLQQFRRTLDAILGSEILRIENWRPSSDMVFEDDVLAQQCRSKNLWGQSRFSIGLWVGEGLTPNIFPIVQTPTKDNLNAQGALSHMPKNRRSELRGEPAQINKCPCCKTTLAIPHSKPFSKKSKHELIWIIKTDRNRSIQDLEAIPDSEFVGQGFKLCKKDGIPAKSFKHINTNESGTYYAMRVNFTSTRSISSDNVDLWWEHTVKPALQINHTNLLQSTKASRPGYFFLYNENSGTAYDFVIHCPNHGCRTWQEWSDKIIANSRPTIPDAFTKLGEPSVSISIPIPAFTVDEQVYGKCPTVIIATTDKFAQLAFKPEAASIFGNVDSHRQLNGFYRKTLANEKDVITDVPKFYPPSLIIQDELHLIEGPLGSMVGVYELAVDVLSSQNKHKTKYVASTATVKEAQRQVEMIYRRSARVFPPHGVYDGENYFSNMREDPTCTENKPGRLYVGVLVTRGMLLGLVKIYASILSSVHIRSSIDNVDPYWTLVGYFNAIRELAIAKSLYNSDIQRDVTKLSSNEYFSTQRKNTSQSFDPTTRFIPIKLTQDSTLNSITIYCTNNLGKIRLALYDSDPKTHKPSKLLSNTERLAALSVATGSNKFLLEHDIKLSRNSIVYVALYNYSNETKFVCGSNVESYVTNSSQHKGHLFVFSTSNCKSENVPIMVSVGTPPRDLDPSRSIELSSIVSSYDLPKILEELETSNSADALFTTSIFGTGVDINRLGLMIVAGQPKSTASYIQSTGRIGRQTPGLVITWLRATRVRDLSHYENFIGYHRSINRSVEPISSAPFSDKSLKTCLGPVFVAILRNAYNINTRNISSDWATNPNYIIDNSNSDDIAALKNHMKELYNKLQTRVAHLSLNPAEFEEISKHTVDRWSNCAQSIARNKSDNTLVYSESTRGPIQHNVVLGTPHHKASHKVSVYENVRYSLRDVEEMFTIKEMEHVEND